MLRGQDDRSQSSRSALAIDGKCQSGFGWMAMEKPPLGPSRFQVPSYQRRTLSRKPPEPLRRAVAACLSASHHANSEAVSTLQDYLSNPSTVDLAYTVLLEHANAERERSPPVVSRCVSLLKRYLIRYVPKHAMLQQVDTFCATMIAECNSASKPSLGSPCSQSSCEPASFKQAGLIPQGPTKAAFASVGLLKSLTYVRSLVARHLPSNLLQSTRIAELSNAYTKRSRTHFTVFGPPTLQGQLDDKESGKSISLLNLEDNEEFLPTNVLKWRWMGGKRNQCWTPSPVMTDSGGISRPQVKQLFEYSGMGAGALFMRGSDFKCQQKQNKQAEKILNYESVAEQLLQPSKVTTITDGGSTQSHLSAIAASKRQKSQSKVWNSDVPTSTWRKRPRPLFQYKQYSEQQPLRLSNSEIEEVLSAFCVEGGVVAGNTQGLVPMLPVVHPGRGSFGIAAVAGSVLIKLIIDMYMAGPITASPLTFSMLEGLLGSSSTAVRIRCFDSILNLGIHAHLLEPMQMEEQSALGEESMDASALLASVGPFISSKRGLNLEEAFREEERLELMRPQETSGNFQAPVDKVEGATPGAVKIFEIWLLQIFYEMLLFLVQMKETEESVWVAALSCLLYFVCDGSRILRHRLCTLDIRVLKNLLDISWASAWADELRCTLVCMMCNLLYKFCEMDGGTGRNAEFDMAKLELLGGIEFVCLEYMRANSSEAKANLFCVVLDFVLLESYAKHFSSGSQPTADEIQAVVGALLLADSATVLGFVLKHGIKNVGEGLSETISTTMSRDIDSGRLNSQLLKEIIALLDDLVMASTQPDKEFSEHVSLTLGGDESPGFLDSSAMDRTMVSQAIAILNSLLHSSQLSCRLHGYSWLVDLLSRSMGDGDIGLFDNVLEQHILNSSWNKDLDGGLNGKTEFMPSLLAAHQLFYGLLKSNKAVIRRGFLLVLERLLVNYQKLAANSISMQLLEGEAGAVERKSQLLEQWQNKLLGLMNGALLQFVSSNDRNHSNILQMCNVMFSQLCVVLPSVRSPTNPSNTFLKDNMVFNRFDGYQNLTGKNFLSFMTSGQFDSRQSENDVVDHQSYGSSKCASPMTVSLAEMLLKGQAAAPRILISSIPTDLLYWPLRQLAGATAEDMTSGVAVGSDGRCRTSSGASDVRAALLVLLIGKCSIHRSAFEEVGGEEFFRSLLDDMDTRVAYYSASFLLKRMMSEEPEHYQRVLHTLVFRAQKCNNEKLLENPYLQMRGIMQLSNDQGGLMTIHEN